MIRPWALFVLTGLGGAVHATQIDLPAAARQTAHVSAPMDSINVPIDVFRDGGLPMQTVEGAVDRTVWRVEATDLTPLQVMQPLRRQLEDAGYDIVLDCADVTCGGFDFRFSTEVLPGPNMYVNLRSFHHVTAIKGDLPAPDAAITLLVSQAAAAVYVQMIQATALTTPAEIAVITTRAADPATVGDLLAKGHVVLDDLTFETGSAQLGAGPFSSLQAIADFLAQDPDARLALVGHTDTIGGLETNIALSRQRAQSVVERLADAYGVAEARLDAEGMGYLAPIATNQTAEGRDANRRVEAVLLK